MTVDLHGPHLAVERGLADAISRSPIVEVCRKISVRTASARSARDQRACSVCAGRPFFIRIGVSQASEAPAVEQRGDHVRPQPRVEVVDVGLEDERAAVPSARDRARHRRRLADQQPQHVRVAVGVPAAGADADRLRRPSAAAARTTWRGWSAAPRRSACTARARPGPAYDGTPRSSSATAGGGTGIAPCAPRDPAGADRHRRDDQRRRARGARARRRPRRRRRSRRARRPRGSAPRRATCRAPRASATASRSKVACARVRGRPSGSAAAASRARRRARCGGSLLSATSTWQPGGREPVPGHGLRRRARRARARPRRPPRRAPRAARRRRAARRAACRRWRPRRRRPSRSRARSRGAALRATRAANTPAPKPLSMFTTVTPGAQELSIAEQRGQPAERGAVADAGRHRDQRHADQPADHARQRALHAGDHDEAVGASSSSSRTARTRCSPATPTSVTTRDAGAVHPGGQGGLGGDRRVGGAGGHHRTPCPARPAAGRA